MVGSACFSITGQFMQKTLEDNQNENWIALYVINSILQTFDNTLNLFFAQLVNIWKGLQNSLALFRFLWSPRNFIHQLFPPPKKSVKAKMDFFCLLILLIYCQCSRRRWNQNAHLPTTLTAKKAHWVYCWRSLIKVKFSTDKIRLALGSGGCSVGWLSPCSKNLKIALFHTFSTWHPNTLCSYCRYG